MSASSSTLRERRAHGYEGPRQDIQEIVSSSATRILELGCSTGALGEAIKLRQTALIVGVEIDPDYAADAEARLDRVVTASAEDFLDGGVPPEAPFDCLIAADVFEHLVEPAGVLTRAVKLLSPGAQVVFSVPNVLYWPQFKRVLAGDWPADDQGIFDRTHLRWFTPATARAMATDAGLTDVKLFPQEWPLGRKHKPVSTALKAVGLARFTPAQVVISARVPAAVESSSPAAAADLSR